jgi:hypothetical protein
VLINIGISSNSDIPQIVSIYSDDFEIGSKIVLIGVSGGYLWFDAEIEQQVRVPRWRRVVLAVSKEASSTDNQRGGNLLCRWFALSQEQ